MKILFEDCVRKEETLYFICRDFNIFCSMDIISGEISIIDSLPEGNARSRRLGAKIVNWKNQLYFAPMCAEKIWRYDLDHKTWSGYERKVIDNWTESKEMFQAIAYEEKICFIGAYYPAIIIMDPLTEKMEYITAPYENRIELSEDKRDCWFRTDYVLVDNTLYLASCIDNTVFCFNMDTYEYEYKKVGSDTFSYSGITWDGDCFYLSPRKDGPIVIWDGKDEVTQIEIDIDNPKKKAVFGGAVSLGEKIVFPACFSRDTIELTKTNNDIKRIEKQYVFYKIIDDETVVNLDIEGNVEISWRNNKYKHMVKLSDAIIGQQIKKVMLERGDTKIEIENETEKMTLECFINMI